MYDQEELIRKIKGNLIVSCQALDNEPLHSSFIMGRMARAAKEGGACGIRANTVEDILEIRKNVELPMIGIIKRDYEGSDVYITATMKEVDELAEAGPDIVALDATGRLRPGGQTLQDFYHEIRKKHPGLKLMADTSTVEEALEADRLGFDFVGTTMVGYTPESKDFKIEADDFAMIRQILAGVSAPVIAEGNIDTPQKAKRVIELGCCSVVVGGAITRPQLITRKFSSALK